MLVSGGYPGDYKKGIEISGLDQLAGNDNEWRLHGLPQANSENPSTRQSIVFHAGTKDRKGGVVTNGGRVMAISSLGENMDQALERCYQTAKIINFEGMYYRKDIGKDLI
jgi:phosphoribosylamine---glycine ligase